MGDRWGRLFSEPALVLRGAEKRHDLLFDSLIIGDGGEGRGRIQALARVQSALHLLRFVTRAPQRRAVEPRLRGSSRAVTCNGREMKLGAAGNVGRGAKRQESVRGQRARRSLRARGERREWGRSQVRTLRRLVVGRDAR